MAWVLPLPFVPPMSTPRRDALRGTERRQQGTSPTKAEADAEPAARLERRDGRSLDRGHHGVRV